MLFCDIVSSWLREKHSTVPTRISRNAIGQDSCFDVNGYHFDVSDNFIITTSGPRIYAYDEELFDKLEKYLNLRRY